MALDTDRLIKDLRAGADAADVGTERTSFMLIGMARAWRVLASAIEDGEYNLEPSTRTIAEVDPDWDAPENVIPGMYDSDDLDRIAAQRDRKENR